MQDVEPADLSSAGGGIMQYFGFIDQYAQWIAPWGTARRQWQLRRVFYELHNTLVSGALVNLMQRIIQTPTELSGGPRKTHYWNSLFQMAQFGAGWDDFLSPVLQDFLTIDQGAFIEIIAPGKPDKPISQQVVGVAHLDSLRCYPTGNPEFPVYYRSHRQGGLHKLHWTRVVRLVDTPSPDPQFKGMGMCALSRALAVVQVQMMMSKYQVENLDDLPPKGILSLSGVNEKQWNEQVNKYEADRQRDGQEILRQIITAFSVNPASKVEATLTPFSTLPDAFKYPEMMGIHVNLLAVAIGEDPQEIFPLTGQALGTGAQSKVLHAKGKAKTYGAILKMLGRTFNVAVLPPDLELKFKPKDTDQDLASAETAKKWAEVANDLKNAGVPQDRILQLLANTVEQYADVLLDEAGNLRLPDDDVKPADEVTATDDATNVASQPEEETVTQTETRQARKDLNSTKIDFESDFKDLLRGVQADDLSRRRSGIVARALLSRYINASYREGLKIGGVNPDDISADDLATIARQVAEQSGYITNMLNAAYGDGLSDEAIAVKADMWWNKSVYPAYMAGLASADRNGYYEWEYGDTIEHCGDCRTLEGQIHRYRDYERTGWLPKATKLECGGYNCDCGLEKRTGVRSRGRFPSGGSMVQAA